MRERHMVSLRIGYGERSREFRIGRTGLMATVAALALLFFATTHFLYDYRENLSKIRDLRSLRQRVSEQNLTLYNLYSKFESLETDVERLRALDSRVRALARINQSLSPGGAGKASRATGIGGLETQEAAATTRLDRLLDLRFDQLKKDVLVDAKDLEALREELDIRRIVLESIPAFWPVKGILSSGFGVRTSPFTDTPVFHHGLDIVASSGVQVRAAAAGKVVRSGYESLFGNVVVLEHGYGYRSLYAHLRDRAAAAGDIVQKGDPIGTVGDTGRTTGPHLHFEVHVNGLAVNPSRFLH
ncbi:MAG TPA: peptidoglycan DD-metalloendopeptidase family protein [Candidatus Limnocylindrales bacterium]|nr:peptidoglycan DD-metalloendopeptidase family protein [Candidatus Limnocylindrales bacterium]